MTISITPGDFISGDISLPGDKSISHRAILLSALSHNVVDISGISTGEDVLKTITAMRALGVPIFLECEKKQARVEGVGLHGLKPSKNPIDCGNSGTLMRLLSGILCAQKFDSILIGDDSLSTRPMLRIAEPLRLMGANIILSPNNRAPIKITGNQALQAINYELPIPSAQVKSAILLAGLYTREKTIVHEKIKTRDHTERMLSLNNISCIDIPGDISAAAFFIVLATLKKGSQLTLKNVGVNPFRRGILTILKKMGANIIFKNEKQYGNEPVADIIVKYAPLKGITIPEECVTSAIDEFPIIFIAAACASGKTRLSNARELRFKESDRLAVMAANLKKLGVTVTEFETGIEIEGGNPFSCTERLDAHNDHRIAMALSIAGHLASTPISIDNADFIKTSFPDFIDICGSLGMQITEQPSL